MKKKQLIFLIIFFIFLIKVVIKTFLELSINKFCKGTRSYD